MAVIDGTINSDFLDGTNSSDFMRGLNLNDTLRGFDGDDSINGNGENDYVIGNRGNDTLFGGQGNDTVTGGQGNDLLFGDLGDDSLYGDRGADTMTGSNGNDLFVIGPDTGGPNLTDADVITDFRGEGTGGTQRDLIGLQGNLSFEGLNNTFDGLNIDIVGNDTIIQDKVTGQFLVVLQNFTRTLTRGDFQAATPLPPVAPPTSTPAPTPTPTPTPTPSGSVDLSVTKTADVTSITAGDNLTYTLTVRNNSTLSATNVVLTDTLPTGSTFVSSTGLAVTSSGNTVTANLGTIPSAGTSTLTLVITTPTNATSITNTASVTGSQSDPNTQNNTASVTTTISGSSSGAGIVLTGDATDNTLVGTSGNDTITGAGGSDALTGNGGNDTFAYSSSTEGVDTITDFNSGDLFQISAAGFGTGLVAGTPLSTVASATGVFVGGFAPAPLDASPTFLYNTASGTLSFDADGTGGGVSAVSIATLTGAPALSPSSFTIV